MYLSTGNSLTSGKAIEPRYDWQNWQYWQFVVGADETACDLNLKLEALPYHPLHFLLIMQLEYTMLGAVQLLLFAVSSSSAFQHQPHPSAALVMPARSSRTKSASFVARGAGSTALREQSNGGDKEREIAALEERLAELRGEGSSEGDVIAAATSALEEEEQELPPDTMAPDDGFDMNAYRKRVANIKEPPPGEFLSEAWKESVEDQPGLGDTLKTLGIGAGIILALVAFSQIPIGDDGLAKYSEKIGL